MGLRAGSAEGAAHAEQPSQVRERRVVALGGVGAYAAGEWLKAGAQAVCVDSTLLGDAYSGGSLGQLRDRCASFVAVNKRGD